MSAIYTSALFQRFWGWCIAVALCCSVWGVYTSPGCFCCWTVAPPQAPWQPDLSPAGLPKVAKAFTEPAEIEAYGKAAARHINVRYLHWHRRHTTVANKGGWRPRRRHRVSTKKWLAVKDNMLFVGTAYSGLASFCYSQGSKAWHGELWEKWARLNLCQDQGPDGLSGIAALLYKPSLRANCAEWWGEFHGLHNDVFGCFEHHQLLPFILLSMCVQNLPHGPEKERDLRLNQMKGVTEMLFRTFTASNCHSFGAHSGRMARELAGDFARGPGATVEESLLQHLARQAPFEKHERLSHMCRFMSWVRGNKILLKQWDTLLWKLEV